MSSDYASYLRDVALPKDRARLSAFLGLEQQLQDMKNSGAPSVSGSGSNGLIPSSGKVVGGGGSGYGSNAGNPIARSAAQTGPIKLVNGKIVPAVGRISQGWGKSRITYVAGRHTGMDFFGAYGSAIRSAANGVVTRIGNEGAYGNAIHVRHADGTTALYAHLSGINVKPGQRVKVGQTVGRMGSTGRSSGTHLHFEIRKQDRYGGDINPRHWFSSR